MIDDDTIVLVRYPLDLTLVPSDMWQTSPPPSSSSSPSKTDKASLADRRKQELYVYCTIARHPTQPFTVVMVVSNRTVVEREMNKLLNES
jgi:hypothetical protein